MNYTILLFLVASCLHSFVAIGQTAKTAKPDVYTTEQIQEGLYDSRSLVIAGTLLTGSSVACGAAAYGLAKLIYNAQLNRYENKRYYGISPGGGTTPHLQKPVNHTKAVMYGVGIPIACAGIAITVLGATRLVQWKARKKDIKMQTGLLDDGTVGMAFSF